MELQFFVSSDVVHGGYDETGYPLERLVYYVIGESPAGHRFAHFKGFNNEPEATVFLGRVQHAYSLGLSINQDYWHEIDPAYGSEAYQRLDNEKFFRNREIMEAHEAGEISEREAIDYMMR
jgi:hypothetical protein